MSSNSLPQAGPEQQIASVQQLMAGLIDYAGLFPPSQLPLEKAIHEYAGCRAERDRWMLARCIIPAAQLPELRPHAALFGQQPPFRFSVIIPGAASYDSFLDTLHGGLAQIHAFEREHGDRVRIEMIETRLPVSSNKPDNPERLLPFFESLEHTVLDDLGRSLDVFFEIPWRIHYQDAFESTCDDLFDHVATAMHWYNRQPEGQRIHVGFKLRCGGPDPEKDVPAPEIVASALWHVLQNHVPFKATAGLHHPIRHYRDGYGGMMHGFLNIFGAGILGFANKLTQDELTGMIAESDPRAFSLTDERMAWRDWSATVEQIGHARAQFGSFGSCSFDEPREDLVRLRLLS